jgi:phosphoenolpyruvate carboxykinase (ATP)
LKSSGVSGLGTVHYNLLEPALIEAALRRGEGRLGKGGAFLVSTGKFTGRSPKDKFVVRTPSVERRDLVGQQRADGARRLRPPACRHAGAHEGRRIFRAGPLWRRRPEHRLDVRVVSELAWHNLFIRHLLRRPSARSLTPSRPSSRSSTARASRPIPNGTAAARDTVIALNFEKKLILIANTEYAGENKKSVFTLLNYILPGKGVMAMHCSANHANGDPDDAAVFFGLSGTGKTTLSA